VLKNRWVAAKGRRRPKSKKGIKKTVSVNRGKKKRKGTRGHPRIKERAPARLQCLEIRSETDKKGVRRNRGNTPLNRGEEMDLFDGWGGGRLIKF